MQIIKILGLVREAISRVGLRLAIVMVGYVFLAILAVALSGQMMNMLAAENTELIKVRDNMTYMDQLRSSLLQAESSERGYLLTMRDSYLIPYINAVKQTQSLTQTLIAQLNGRAGASRNAHYEALIKETSLNIEAKLAEMQIPISLAHNGNLSAARLVVNTDVGLNKMTQIFRDLDALSAAENVQLIKHRNTRDNLLLIGRGSVALSVLLVLILLTAVIRKLFAEITNRDRTSTQLKNEVVDFERQLGERTALLKMLAVDYQYDVERERRNLARELHDELGSILTASKMDISWVLKKLTTGSPEASEKLYKTMRHLDQAIQHKRRIVEELHPPMLSTFGLIPALKALIESAAERNSWQLDVVLPEPHVMISEALGLIAYRLVQETLNNASKYARASHVLVHLVVDEDFLKLEIEDNGVGMDMTKRLSGTHGLEGMRHRVIAIGGTLKIESTPDQGMQTLALIPLDAAPDEHPEDRLIAQPSLLTQSAPFSY